MALTNLLPRAIRFKSKVIIQSNIIIILHTVTGLMAFFGRPVSGYLGETLIQLLVLPIKLHFAGTISMHFHMQASL